MGRHEKPAVWKWGALALGIIALEASRDETLSASFRRGLENNHTRPLVLLGMGVTVLHLLDALPGSLDPYALLGRTEQFITELKKPPVIAQAANGLELGV